MLDIVHTMKKLLTLLLLLLVSQLSFSQTEKDNYEIYSLVLTDCLKFGINSKQDSIVLIEQYNSEFKKSDYEIFDPKSDSITKTDINFLYISTDRDTVFIKRVIKEPLLKKVIVDFTVDFNIQPKLNSEFLTADNLNIQSITSKKFRSFFGKKHWRKNSWKRIKRKYGVDKVIELSKINYSENFCSVYYGIHCGGLCGRGAMVVCEKIKGKWIILTAINLRES